MLMQFPRCSIMMLMTHLSKCAQCAQGSQLSRESKQMKAIHIHGRGGPDHLVYEDAPQPSPGPGEVLVRVYAAGVIATELKWDETYQTKAGSPLTLPIPGRDLSGVVAEVGPGVTSTTLIKGSEVYALLD